MKRDASIMRVGKFSELEGQMTSIAPPGAAGSPDHMDAPVWVLAELASGGSRSVPA